MDDELKAIQDDLDSVLERIEKQLGGDDEKAKKEFAASVVYNRALYRKEKVKKLTTEYEHSIFDSFVISDGWDRHRRVYFPEILWSDKECKSPYTIEKWQEKKAEFMYAMQVVIDAYNRSLPVPRSAIETLRPSIVRYLDYVDRYPGEWALDYKDRRQEELEYKDPFMHPKKGETSINRKLHKQDALAREVWLLHKSDPKKYPIDESLFGIVGDRYGYHASTVNKAFYSEHAKRQRWWHERNLEEIKRAEQANGEGDW
tara:strand:- start:18217 stop:18990 length:774 start_codon:yes stop_codon:yes gene_type:complete